MSTIKTKKIIVQVCIVFSILASGCSTADVTAPVKLTVSEGFENPFGFYDAKPSFSWKLPQNKNIEKQTAYQIVVASESGLLPDKADLWDSDKIQSDQSVWVSYQGKPLNSRQHVYWQVKFWDEKDQASKWSEPAEFELGLLKNDDWKGSWIRMQGGKVYEPPTMWKESDSRALKADVSIVIHKAVYGKTGDHSKQVDITQRLRDMVASGIRVITISPELAGNDPVPGEQKELYLEYNLNPKLFRTTLKDGEKFDLAKGQKPVIIVPEMLRKEFELHQAVKNARLYITAHGVFEAYINGSRVGEEFMLPGWTPFHKRVETLSYDVTQLLQDGQNVIGAKIAEGWYAGRILRKADYPLVFPELLCQLEITYKNGTQVLIASDDSWKATDQGPIQYSGIYDGEVYDARKEMPGWNKPGFDDSAWNSVLTENIDSSVALVPKRHNPVRVTQVLPALNVTEPKPGHFVFDLGQNMIGLPRLTIPVQAERTIKLRVAEILRQDGSLYTDNYRSARSLDYYTAKKDGVISWHPTFTFHGFRYVELSGFPEGTKPALDWVNGMVLHSDFERKGSFSSSSEKLNRLQKNITWGQRSNFLDIPTDCPQRDERLGWTGDAQVFCPTSFFNYDVYSFWASWLQSVKEEQHENGIIPWIVPTDRIDGGSPGWGDVAVTAPWDVFVRTGDMGVLEENYDMMKRWVDAYEREANNFIVSRAGFGDWLQPYSEGNLDPIRGALAGETSLELIATAYFGRCSRIMMKVANALGFNEEAAHYKKQFANIRTAFSQKFFDKSGKLTTTFDTQTAYLMALSYELLEPKLRKGATQNLLRKIEEADGHLRTGFLGTPLLTFVLEDLGYTDLAYEILFKESYPSWFYPINQGATTMWERWNSYSHEDGFGDANMNSFNHYAYGAIGQWMYEGIAGLAPDEEHPGYKHFFIKPTPGKQLNWAKAELETPYGKALSGWERVDDGLVIQATVPPNTTATLVIPASFGENPKLSQEGKPCQLIERDGLFTYEIKSGENVFRVKKGF